MDKNKLISLSLPGLPTFLKIRDGIENRVLDHLFCIIECEKKPGNPGKHFSLSPYQIHTLAILGILLLADYIITAGGVLHL